jgi:glycosyltransferase involved in cell wall biosynthesis
MVIIVPCLNEEDILQYTHGELYNLLLSLINEKSIHPDSNICYIDDGSTDSTWEIIKKLCLKNSNTTGIKLSRNFGHQNAIIAGLESMVGSSDFSITIDADLQDDINKIPEMIQAYNNGSEIVFGIRSSRTQDKFIKKITAGLFYKTLSVIDDGIVPDHADFRLMSNKAISALLSHNEYNIFLRGIVSKLGFQTSKVYYARKKRLSGKTKYPYRKMISFALDGVFSHSVRPLRKLLIFACMIIILSFIYILHIFYVKFVTGTAIPGWTSIVLPIIILGSLQIIAIGLLGEYLAKVIMDVKKRPRYIIDEKIK